MTRYTHPRGSAHDMQELAGLSDVPDKLLLLSERSLSILNDLVRIDAAFYARYAQDISDGGYTPVAAGTADAVLVDEYVNALQLEVLPVSPEIKLLTRLGSGFVYQNYVPGFGENEAVSIGGVSLGGGTVYWDSLVPGTLKLYRLLGFVTYYLGALNTVNLFIGAKHASTYIPFWKQAPALNGVPYVGQVDVPILNPDAPFLEAQGLGAGEAAYAVFYGVLVTPEAPA